MTVPFKSTYDEHDEFYAFVDLLHPTFGQWDAYDPVARAILDVVEAQNELAGLFTDNLFSLVTESAFKEVVEQRHAAGQRLMRALEDRESWPDPKLGRR